MSSSLTPLGPQTLGQWTSEQEQMVLAALAAQVQQANQGATQAQGQYQQAAAAPMPQISPFAAFAPSLLGGIASVISGNPTYQRDANAGVEASRESLVKRRMENLQALETNWKQKAEAARQIGNIQAEMEARTKLDGIHKQYETIQKANAERSENERLDKTLKSNREIAEIKERGSTESLAPSLTPAGMDAAAISWAKTGVMVPMGMGKAGVAVREKIINRAAELFPNLDLAANKANFASNQQALTSLRRIYNGAKAFESTALKNANVMLRTMAKVPNTASPLLNRPLREISTKGLGSAEMAAFNVARQTVVPEFARILNSPTMAGQLTDTARKELEAIVRGDYSLKQMQAAIDVLRQDAANRTSAYQAQIQELQSEIGKMPGAAAPGKDVEYIMVNGKLVPK